MFNLVKESQIQSNELLSLLLEEQIRTPENPGDEGRISVNRKINAFRPIIQNEAQQYPAAGLTGCAALTFLKLGACQELTLRFVLEYFLRFRSTNVSLIFTSNSEFLAGDNHCFCLVGEIVAEDGLMIGRGAKPTVSADKEFFIPIQTFLSGQPKGTVVVDPLLNFCNIANDPCKTLVDYCRNHTITHVIGIRQYPQGFVDNAPLIKTNAELIADKIRRIQEGNVERLRSDARASLIQVIQKFKLDPSKAEDVEIREQAFRRASMSGTNKDLSLLLSTGINIDAQDENPKKQNTALHMALIYKKFDNAKFLIKLNARMDVANADGVTAGVLIGQLGAGKIQDELRILIGK